MTTTWNRGQAAKRRVRHRVGRWLSGVPRKFSKWHQRHRQRRSVLRLDERVLRDVGLRRVDVYRQALKPFWRD